MSDLLPCPFCGFTALLIEEQQAPSWSSWPPPSFWIKCQNPDCICSLGDCDEGDRGLAGFYRNAQAAATDWNKRA